MIGFSQSRVAGSDWYKTLIKGATEEAAKQGVTLKILDANGDILQQSADISTLVTMKVDAIIVNPQDPLGLRQSIAAALAANIHVTAVNAGLDDSILKTIYGFIKEDSVATGARGGYLLAQAVAARNPSLVGKTVKAIIIGGYQGAISSELRAKGFMTGYAQWLTDHPGKGVNLTYLPMRYGHWLASDAMPIMRDVATANPDLKVVFSESDVMHAGLVQALKQAGVWNNITMAEYDGYESTVKEMMDDPNDPVQALTTNEPYRQGVAAVDMALRAIQGHAPEGTVFLDTVAMNNANAAKFYDASKVLVDTVQSSPEGGTNVSAATPMPIPDMLKTCDVGWCRGT